jgi:hypothetical protein
MPRPYGVWIAQSVQVRRSRSRGVTFQDEQGRGHEAATGVSTPVSLGGTVGASGGGIGVLGNDWRTVLQVENAAHHNGFPSLEAV